MSTLKANNLQVGQSATASNNFTLYTPATPDGTLRIGVGNSLATTKDVLKVNADGGVSLMQPCFSAYQSTAVSLTQNVDTKVLFQTEEYDTTNNYDPATSRFTATIAGYYHIIGMTAMAGQQATVQTKIYKNGSQYRIGQFGATQNMSMISTIVPLNAGDYVEIYCQQGQPTQNSQIGSSYTYFQGFLVRAL